jgi:hypothetical protein
MVHFRLKGNVSRTNRVNEDDTVKTKIALRELGYYDIPDYGFTDFPDEAMFQGIKKFQKDKGLRVDEKMNSNGRTQWELNKALPEKNPFNDLYAPTPPEPKCPEGKGSQLNGICVPGTDICYYWWECVEVPSGSGSRW